MKERPILFKGSMVRALLEGRKTNARRIVDPQPKSKVVGGAMAFGVQHFGPDLPARPVPTLRWADYDEAAREHRLHIIPCPYGQPGDRLWVRETWAKVLHGSGVPLLERWEPGKEGPFGVGAVYAATPMKDYARIKYKPSIHMPRWASRLTLEVTSVKVERLHDMTPGDMLAEGVADPHMTIIAGVGVHDPDRLRAAWIELWESIHGPGSWGLNPWIWAVAFPRVQQRMEWRKAVAMAATLEPGPALGRLR